MSRIERGQTGQERRDQRPHLRGPGDCPDSPAAGMVRTNARRHHKLITPLGASAGYVLFALAVHLRWLDSLDRAVRSAAHVGDGWGPVQRRAARVVNDLQPSHLAIALLLFATFLSSFRRSPRPLVVVITVGIAAVMVTLGTKFVMAHWDPGTPPVRHASFPSGHTVTVIVACGLVVLLCRPGTRWGWILPAFMGCFVGNALVLAWVHPVTDVLGAGLLAFAALTAATAAGLGQWARPRRTTWRGRMITRRTSTPHH